MNKKHLSIVAILISLAALVLAITASFHRHQEIDRAVIAKEVYKEILTDLKAELLPVYEDLDIEISKDANTFKEIIAPLVSMPDIKWDQTARPPG